MVVMDCVVRIGACLYPDQRRLTLAPGDLSPVSTSPSSGSRFEALAVEWEEAAKVIDADRVATQVVDAVLSGDWCDDDGGQWSIVKSRRRKTKEEIVQEFWADVRFPRPASRVWERGCHTPIHSIGCTACQPRDHILWHTFT
jgi:hypothetical protein